MSESAAYGGFWRRKRLLAQAVPRFPVLRWWKIDGLCQNERLYFEAVRASPSILDVGAGDLRIKRKFHQAGYRGRYDTLDITTDHDYTYSRLADVRRNYGAILCLDVIEHISFEQGLAMLNRLVELLEPAGILIIQTPNARCVRHPLSWDMTHLHCYNGPDLWAYLTCLGLEVDGYRVVFGRPCRSPLRLLRSTLARFVITRLLGCDYADNIALVVKKVSK